MAFIVDLPMKNGDFPSFFETNVCFLYVYQRVTNIFDTDSPGAPVPREVLVVKLLSMTLGIAAGLPMGKDGPNVHISACAAGKRGSAGLGSWGGEDPSIDG
jgi:hypothetical protein